jgi:uncharacterized protein YeaO (DUF488 family)
MRRRCSIEELRGQRLSLTEFRRRTRSGTLILAYAARGTEHNDSIVLAEVASWTADGLERA